MKKYEICYSCYKKKMFRAIDPELGPYVKCDSCGYLLLDMDCLEDEDY